MSAFGCANSNTREVVWLPEASSVRISLASQTSLRNDAPPVDVSFTAQVLRVVSKGTQGTHVQLLHMNGQVDTLVLALPTESAINLRIEEMVRIRYASASFGKRDRRAGVSVRTTGGTLLLLVHDSGLPANTELPVPLTVDSDQRVTYTVAERSADYCYRVVEHRAFEVFDGQSKRSVAPGDPPVPFTHQARRYAFTPIEHRVEIKSDACNAPLTPRRIWMTYISQRPVGRRPPSSLPLESTQALP